MNREQHIPNPDVRNALGRDRFPIYSHYRGESHAICLPDSVLRGEPYRIRSLLIVGGSSLLPGLSRLYGGKRSAHWISWYASIGFSRQMPRTRISSCRLPRTMKSNHT